MKRDKDALELQDFLSCLRGFIKLLGIDRVHDSEVLYPVRRAVVPRALLGEGAKVAVWTRHIN